MWNTSEVQGGTLIEGFDLAFIFADSHIDRMTEKNYVYLSRASFHPDRSSRFFSSASRVRFGTTISCERSFWNWKEKRSFFNHSLSFPVLFVNQPDIKVTRGIVQRAFYLRFLSRTFLEEYDNTVSDLNNVLYK